MVQIANAMMIERLESALRYEIGDGAKQKLLKYSNLILSELQKQRITGAKTAGELVDKQLYDSLYPLHYLKIEDGSQVLDLGTGGGMPGMPFKILIPALKLYLLDSSSRKMKFLEQVAFELDLEEVHFILERAENAGQQDEHRERYDYVLCRAVAETAILAELCLPLLRIGGRAFLYKGPRGEQEAVEAEFAINLCGGVITEKYNYNLASGEKRALHILEKIRPTPANYPRAVGKPGKKPLKG